MNSINFKRLNITPKKTILTSHVKNIVSCIRCKRPVKSACETCGSNFCYLCKGKKKDCKDCQKWLAKQSTDTSYGKKSSPEEYKLPERGLKCLCLKPGVVTCALCPKAICGACAIKNTGVCNSCRLS